MNIYPLIGNRIRAERTKRKLTLAQLAEAASISASFLNYIELGTKKPSIDTIRDIAGALRMPLKSFFTFRGLKEASADSLDGLDTLLRGKSQKERELILKVVKVISKELKKDK